MALVVALALTASVYAYHAGYAVPIGDELDILKPAVEHMHGVLRPDVKYPSFPFLFYGACLRLSGTLEDPQRALVVARAVNASLLGVAVMLIYALGRELVRQPFALLAALVHLMMPNTLAQRASSRPKACWWWRPWCVCSRSGRFVASRAVLLLTRSRRSRSGSA